MVNYKKAISPVVATALLLVVAVVAVVGFQSWFATYQSGINVKVEQESVAGSSIYIERLEATNGVVYVRNNAQSEVTVQVKVPANNCTGSMTVASKSINSTDTTGCSSALEAGKTYDVVAVTDSGVFQATHIAR